jgi:uncharacterized membrane protein
MDPLFQQLYDTPLAAAIRESGTLFPWIESVHVLAIVTVVGTITVWDLRLLGLAWRHRAIGQLRREVVPITWIAFVIAAITGVLLFSSNAVKYSHNTFFLWKMGLLVLALVNVVIFDFITAKGMARWNDAPRPPAPAAISGAVSLVVWTAVIVCGRWIGFTMSVF